MCAELFPLFVGVWLTAGVPDGVSARGAAALLVAANYAGGACGGGVTFALNHWPHKGRLVVGATGAYGVCCFGFGCTRQLLLGTVFVFLMGAFDAVGAAMRNQARARRAGMLCSSHVRWPALYSAPPLRDRRWCC